MATLNDYIEGTVDNRGRNPKYLSQGPFPVIDNVLIKNDLYPDVDEATRFLDQELFDNFLRGYVHKNMPIMTLVGNGIGNVALAPSDKVAIVQNTIGYQVNEKMDEVFLYYYLLNNQERIRSFNRGSGQPSIRKTDILGMEVIIPSLEIQKKIAKVLFTIDQTIHNNNKMSKILFEQARTVYKAHFVDFLPYEGAMPVSWRTGTASEIIDLYDSKRIPLSNRERAGLKKIYPYYGATSVMDYVDKYIFDGIYLLLGEDGTVVDDAGHPILQYVDGKFWVNNHAHVITGKNGFNVELLYLLFSLTNIQGIVTGAVQKKISQMNLNKVPVVIPTSDALEKMDRIIQPLFSQIRNIRMENKSLLDLRSSLLPRMMSEELNVSNISL